MKKWRKETSSVRCSTRLQFFRTIIPVSATQSLSRTQISFVVCRIHRDDPVKSGQISRRSGWLQYTEEHFFLGRFWIMLYLILSKDKYRNLSETWLRDGSSPGMWLSTFTIFSNIPIWKVLYMFLKKTQGWINQLSWIWVSRTYQEKYNLPSGDLTASTCITPVSNFPRTKNLFKSFY